MKLGWRGGKKNNLKKCPWHMAHTCDKEKQETYLWHRAHKAWGKWKNVVGICFGQGETEGK